MARHSDAHNLSMFSSVAKLKYLRLMYSPREPLRIPPGIVDTLLILDVVEFKTCTRVYRDSTEASRVDDVGSKWAQWWETAEQDIANVGEQDVSFLDVTMSP